MSDQMSEREYELRMSQGLQRQAATLQDAPWSLDDVRGRATVIRRRRRIAAGAAGVLAAAVLVPVGLFGAANFDDRTGPEPAVPSPPDRTEQLDPGARSGGYLTYARFHRPDGRVVRLPGEYHVDAFALGAATVQATKNDDREGYVVSVVDAENEVVEEFETHGSFVAHRDGDRVAFVDRDGNLISLEASSGSESGYTTSFLTDGFDADDTLVAFEARGVYVQEATGEVVRVTESEVVDVPLPGAIELSDVRGSTYAVVTRTQEENGVCSRLMSGRRPVGPETCEYLLRAIAPDERHVVAEPAFQDGYGTAFAAILDRDGRVVARYTPPSGADVVSAVVFGAAVWEDDDSVLFAVNVDYGAWSLVRLSVDGTSEVVAGPSPGSADRPGYVPTS